MVTARQETKALALGLLCPLAQVSPMKSRLGWGNVKQQKIVGVLPHTCKASHCSLSSPFRSRYCL